MKDVKGKRRYGNLRRLRSCRKKFARGRFILTMITVKLRLYFNSFKCSVALESVCIKNYFRLLIFQRNQFQQQRYTNVAIYDIILLTRVEQKSIIGK